MYKLNYRPDIDGLRGVAILSVMAFHAFPRVYTSGFIGVDIFFVISGFLITKILLHSHSENSFSFVEFYQRRVIRLFPSLLLMFVIFGILAWMFFITPEFVVLGKHLRTGSFLTNYVFSSEENYFDFLKNDKKPLLHFWSLALEEQFYLLWPLVLAVFYRTRFLFSVIISLILLSFVSNVFLVERFPKEVFYLLHGRGWELLIGCLLAFYSFKKGEVPSFILKNLVSFLGVGGLYFSFSHITFRDYPGWQALLPTVSTALIILGGASAILNRFVLSRPELIYIGRISYPLYIWHWVLLAFANILSFPETGLYICVLFAFLLSALSYELVEKPLRNFSGIARTRLFWCLGAAMIAFIVTGELMYREKLLPFHSGLSHSQVVEAMSDYTDYKKEVSHVNDGKNEYSVFGKGPEKILLIGDSHMRMFVPYYLRHADRSKYQFTIVSQHACPIIPALDTQKPCASFYRTALTLGKREEFKKIIIASFWANSFLPDEINNSTAASYQRKMNSLGQFLKELNGPGKKVFVLEGIPFGTEFDPYLMFKRKFFKATVNIRPGFFNLKKFRRDFDGFNKTIEDITRKSQGIYVPTIPFVCPDNRCEIMSDGKPIYFDKAHVRRFFVQEKALFLQKILDT